MRRTSFIADINVANVPIGVLFGWHLRGDQSKIADTQRELVSIQDKMAMIVMAGEPFKMKFLLAL